MCVCICIEKKTHLLSCMYTISVMCGDGATDERRLKLGGCEHALACVCKPGILNPLHVYLGFLGCLYLFVCVCRCYAGCQGLPGRRANQNKEFRGISVRVCVPAHGCCTHTHSARGFLHTHIKHRNTATCISSR